MSEFVKYQLSFHDLGIDPQSIAPILGYEGELPDYLLQDVKEVMDETDSGYEIRGGYQIFDRISFEKDNYILRVNGQDFHVGKIVYNQLKNSEKIAVFVCSAGHGIEEWTKKSMSQNEPLKGFIADILGSTVVEAAIERIQQTLNEQMNSDGLKITNRYSPGYCGWPTQEQQSLFALLDDTCGIQLTDSFLMYPIKSVSGFIGIGKNVRFNPYTCRLCDIGQCIYRNKSQHHF
jgi:hypothetical protein